MEWSVFYRIEDDHRGNNCISCSGGGHKKNWLERLFYVFFSLFLLLKSCFNSILIKWQNQSQRNNRHVKIMHKIKTYFENYIQEIYETKNESDSKPLEIDNYDGCLLRLGKRTSIQW